MRVRRPYRDDILHIARSQRSSGSPLNRASGRVCRQELWENDLALGADSRGEVVVNNDDDEVQGTENRQNGRIP